MKIKYLFLLVSIIALLTLGCAQETANVPGDVEVTGQSGGADQSEESSSIISQAAGAGSLLVNGENFQVQSLEVFFDTQPTYKGLTFQMVASKGKKITAGMEIVDFSFNLDTSGSLEGTHTNKQLFGEVDSDLTEVYSISLEKGIQGQLSEVTAAYTGEPESADFEVKIASFDGKKLRGSFKGTLVNEESGESTAVSGTFDTEVEKREE